MEPKFTQRKAGSYKIAPRQRHILWNKLGMGTFQKGELSGRGYTFASDSHSDCIVYGTNLFVGNATYNEYEKTLLRYSIKANLITPEKIWSSKEDGEIVSDVGSILCLKKRVVDGALRVFIYEVCFATAVFAVWDITDLDNIQRVGSCDITGSGMPASDGKLTMESLFEDYALIGKVGIGICCVDCTDPTSPSVASSYDYPITGSGLSVAGKYVYTMSAATFSILDYSDVSTPVEAGNVACAWTLGSHIEMLQQDCLVLVFSSRSANLGVRVDVIDVTVPASPVNCGYYRFGEELSQDELDAGEALGWEPDDPPYVNLYLGKPSKLIGHRFFYICTKWVPKEYPLSTVSISVVLCDLESTTFRSEEPTIKNLTVRQWDADDDSQEFAAEGHMTGDIAAYSTECLYINNTSNGNYDYIFMFKIKNIVEGWVS